MLLTGQSWKKLGQKILVPFRVLTLYDNLPNSEISSQELKRSESPDVLAVKFYPAGATTNSTFGVSEFESYYRVFEQMEKLDIVLCVHGESIIQK